MLTGFIGRRNVEGAPRGLAEVCLSVYTFFVAHTRHVGTAKIGSFAGPALSAAPGGGGGVLCAEVSQGYFNNIL